MTHESEISVDEFSQKKLLDMIALHIDADRLPKNVRIIRDTTNFFNVEYNDVLILKGRPFLIRNCEREGRFTIDEQPKFWVRRAVDITEGGMKILKMVFHERYNARVGDLVFECFRSPKKESRILELTKGHPNFMQGYSLMDCAGNNVRIIEHITGKTMADEVASLSGSHEDYFNRNFPALLDSFITLAEAIRFLHEHGEKHGDIRRDHIMRGTGENQFRWIDFDYNYWHRESMFGFDLFGLGNVLVFLAAGDEITTHSLRLQKSSALEHITEGDLNMIFNNRIVNLKKIYPYVPKKLNRILLHFSMTSEVFYDDTSQLIGELREARDDLA